MQPPPRRDGCSAAPLAGCAHTLGSGLLTDPWAAHPPCSCRPGAGALGGVPQHPGQQVEHAHCAHGRHGGRRLVRWGGGGGGATLMRSFGMPMQWRQLIGMPMQWRQLIGMPMQWRQLIGMPMHRRQLIGMPMQWRQPNVGSSSSCSLFPARHDGNQCPPDIAPMHGCLLSSCPRAPQGQRGSSGATHPPPLLSLSRCSSGHPAPGGSGGSQRGPSPGGSRGPSGARAQGCVRPAGCVVPVPGRA